MKKGTRTAALLTAMALTAAVPVVAAPVWADAAPVTMEQQDGETEITWAGNSETTEADENGSEQYTFFVTSYAVKQAGTAVKRINQGDKVDLELTIKDPSHMADSFDPEAFDFSRTLDDFTGDEPQVQLVSEGSKAMVLKVVYTGITYTGTGDTLRLEITNNGNTQLLETKISETVTEEKAAKEKEAKEKEEVKKKEEEAKKESQNDNSGSSSSTTGGTAVTDLSDGGSVSVETVSSGYSSGSTSSPVAASIPNIVIDQYSYGGTSAEVGEGFTLKIAFTNTGKLPIENIMVTANGGEVFTVDGTTNTLHYDSLAAGAKQEIEIPFQVVSGAKTGAQNMEIAFKYEYIDNNTRQSVNSAINISIPVSQPARFDIQEPIIQDEINAGEEFTISVKYANKGKGDIYNVEAVIEGDQIETPAAKQYIGNAAAGSSGTIGFAVTPQKSGEQEITLKINYEDADQNLQTKEFKVSFDAQAVPLAGADAEVTSLTTVNTDSSRSAIAKWLPFTGILGAVTAAAGILIRRKNKKAAAVNTEFTDWNGEE